MSYNGSGTFLINTAGQPVVTGTVISSTTFNTLTADLGTGLSTAITKDGQTTTTSRIPFIAGISSTLTTDSTSVGTGSIITSGGVGIAKALWVGGLANITGAVTLGGAVVITSSSANALAVGLNGATNPAFNVDASTASSATGLNVKSAAAAGGVALSVSSSGSNEALTLNAKGTGTIGIGSVSTGAVTITPATTITGAATLSSTLGVTGAASLSSTLAVTGIASFAAGSAAAPAITRTGDLDTGVWFPAANSLGLSSGGTNAVYIDSSQNVGIGTTSPAFKLQVTGANSSTGGINITGTGTNGLRLFQDGSTGDSYINNFQNGFMAFSNNNSEKMRLDSSGNLGIGTSTPAYKLEVASGTSGEQPLVNFRTADSTTANNAGIQIFATPSATATSRSVSMIWDADGANAFGLDYFLINKIGNSGEVQLGQYSNAAMLFMTNGTERMRLDSSGNLLVGTTSTSGSISNTAPVVAGLFKTVSGSFTAADAATTTIATIPSTINGLYIVSIGINANDPTNYSSVSIVTLDGPSTLRITSLQTATYASISVSGMTVRATQSSGGSQTMYFTLTRLS